VSHSRTTQIGENGEGFHFLGPMGTLEATLDINWIPNGYSIHVECPHTLPRDENMILQREPEHMALVSQPFRPDA
jgi:hypothetical protein